MEYVSQFFAIYGSVVNFIGINALLALSLYVTLSAGQLSLGNAAFAGLGGYTAGVLTTRAGVPFLVSLAAGVLAAGLIGLLLGLPVLRLRGVFLAIATLGFGEVVRIIVLNLQVTGGAQGLTGIPPKTQMWHIYLALVLIALLVARLRRSHAGWAWESIRQDETAAATMGVDTTRYKTAAFTLGALIAGLAGALYAHVNLIIVPNEFGFPQAVQILIFNIVGGMTVWYGPVLGAVLLTALPEALRVTGLEAGPARLFVNGLVLLLVILFLPNGLASLFSRRKKTLLAGSEDRRPEEVAGVAGG